MFITSILDQNSENSCWDAGCVDFVSKPVNGVTLLNRIKSHLTLKLQADLLRRMTFLDGLTGLYNRHVLDQITDKGILHAKRSGHPLSVLMIDVDWFKKYNDSYGHLVGDECLRLVANALKQTFRRPTDVSIRFGGEEFLCFLPETDREGAKYLSQALMDAIAKLSIAHNDSPLGRITVSIGCVSVLPTNQDKHLDIVEAADGALYRAKEQGRNQVVFSDK
jgi:diguanylate cyclase (GGDEF)-like protein